ncbi:hypothetical protein [Aeromicrobium sp. IC_218]|uniref:hypothetical protein n=1 Tax=Aeromicrobium sp. IC_218 TaxID=2545468 RepID=UPI0013F3B755|nr:hypothetical protein [Aeromicrobium sp. IC_218]
MTLSPFEEYASDPDMTLSRITELLGARLTIAATPKQTERPLQRSQVHWMLIFR